MEVAELDIHVSFTLHELCAVEEHGECWIRTSCARMTGILIVRKILLNMRDDDSIYNDLLFYRYRELPESGSGYCYRVVRCRNHSHFAYEPATGDLGIHWSGRLCLSSILWRVTAMVRQFVEPLKLNPQCNVFGIATYGACRASRSTSFVSASKKRA